MNNRLDGIITFNPDTETIERIIYQLGELAGTYKYIFDNSTEPTCRAEVRRRFSIANIPVLTSTQGNVGTAGGMNALLEIASRLGCRWFHYLDQDSILTPGYEGRLARIPAMGDISIVGCTFARERSEVNRSVRSSITVISSGSCFNVSQLTEFGGFDTAYFLDLVDTEVCLRTRKMGGTIMVDEHRRLIHPIGEDGRTLFGFWITRHPLWRRRLMWRNSILLCGSYFSTYPGFVIKHLTARTIETVLNAASFHDLEVIRAAKQGVRSGCSKTTPTVS